jgi:hypothetical protein
LEDDAKDVWRAEGGRKDRCRGGFEEEAEALLVGEIDQDTLPLSKATIGTGRGWKIGWERLREDK